MFWIAVILLIIFVYIFVIKPQRHWTRLNIPQVKPWPLLGNLGWFILRKESLADMTSYIYNAHNSRYVGMHLFLRPILMVKNLELIKQIGIKKFDHFLDHSPFISEEADPLFGKNLLTLNGEKWRFMRTTLSPAFTGSKMRLMFPLITECSQQFVNYFHKIVAPNETVTIELKETFSRLANDVIASTAFGIQCDSLQEKNNEFYVMGKRALNFKGLKGLKFFGNFISPRLMKMLKITLFGEEVSNYFRNLFVSNMEMREKNGIIRQDMIHLLMEARKGLLKNEESAESDRTAGFATAEDSNLLQDMSNKPHFELTDDDITAQALLFFFAGFESVAISLSYLFYELALNEDIQKRLQEEIDSTWENCDGKITYEILAKMKYLDMVLSESLRKWPPGFAFDRVCVKPFVIEPENENETQITIEKGTVIWIPAYAIHRDPQYYPNPDKFDPERFNDENKKNIIHCSYLPFGAGPRNCLGSRLALQEVKIITLHILKHFNAVVVEKTDIPLQVTRREINMNSHNGFWIGLKLRQPEA